MANYISKSRAKRAEYNKLSDEEKSYYDFSWFIQHPPQDLKFFDCMKS